MNSRTLIAREPYDRVYAFMRTFPDGFTSKDVADAFPEFSKDERISITHKLAYEGFIKRTSIRRQDRYVYRVRT